MRSCVISKLFDQNDVLYNITKFDDDLSSKKPLTPYNFRTIRNFEILRAKGLINMGTIFKMQQTRSLYLLRLLRSRLLHNSVSNVVVSPTLKMSSTLKRERNNQNGYLLSFPFGTMMEPFVSN